MRILSQSERKRSVGARDAAALTQVAPVAEPIGTRLNEIRVVADKLMAPPVEATAAEPIPTFSAEELDLASVAAGDAVRREVTTAFESRIAAMEADLSARAAACIDEIVNAHAMAVDEQTKAVRCLLQRVCLALAPGVFIDQVRRTLENLLAHDDDQDFALTISTPIEQRQSIDRIVERMARSSRVVVETDAARVSMTNQLRIRWRDRWTEVDVNSWLARLDAGLGPDHAPSNHTLT